MGKGFKLAPWSAQLGMAIIAVNLFLMAFAPVLAPHGETDVVGDVWEVGFWADDCTEQGKQDLLCWAELNKDRDARVWLGTDHLGRDLFSRLMFGARNTILIALVTTILSFSIGISAGFLAATLRGWVDQAISRFVDILMAFPTLIFALMILSVAGTSVKVLIVVIAVLDSTRVYRLARAVAMDVEVMEFVEVARLRGEGLWWLMRREILPNTLPPLVAEFGLRFCFVFLFLAALSFLGLGLQPPTADWGSMVKENAGAITFGIFTPLVPAAAIAVLTIGVNLVVDWFLQKAAGIRHTGEGVKAFEVFARSGDIVAVKAGFTWPGLFFPPLWTAANRLWVPTAILIAAYVVIEIVHGAALEGTDLGWVTWVLYLAVGLTVGVKGNQWKRKAVVGNGFEFVKRSEANTANDAIANVPRQLLEVHA